MTGLDSLALSPELGYDGDQGGEPVNETPEPNADVVTTEQVVEKLKRWSDPAKPVNIAQEMVDDEGELGLGKLSAIGMEVIREAELDDQSRSDWMKKSKMAMDLAMQVAKEKSYPWPGASNIIFPLMTEAADQFAARAYPAIVAGKRVVKGVVFGSDAGIPLTNGLNQAVTMADGTPQWLVAPGEKQKMSDAISEHMSWQLLEEQDEWESETDTLLHVLPIVGCEFRKTYYDPTEGRNFSVRVPAKDLIINYWAKSLSTAPRLTEIVKLYPYEIEEAKRSGYFIEQDYGVALGDGQDKDAPIEFYEQHRRLDLDGDGYSEPYIVTVSKANFKVARIIARYDPDGVLFNKTDNKLAKIVPVHYYTKYDFLPNKEGGIYGQGFGQVLGPLNEAVNATLNMLLDAGHQQNTGGGFVGKGLGQHSGKIKFQPGEWKVINTAGSDIAKAVVPINHKGPSPVLFQLLGTLIEAGKDVSSVKDVLTGEVRAQTMSPTVFMALVEQGLKVFTAIYKRIHRSLRADYDKLFRLNRIYLEEEASYKSSNLWRQIPRSYYQKSTGVEPVSDPNMVADAQKMARSQFLIELDEKKPGLFDPRELYRRALEAASIEDIDRLWAKEQGPNPELLLKLQELEFKGIEVRANAIAAMATAVKNLADADATVAEQFQVWATMQLNMMKASVEALNGKSTGVGAPTPGAAGDSGASSGALLGMEASPGNAGGAAIPSGPAPVAPSGTPESVGTGPSA